MGVDDVSWRVWWTTLRPDSSKLVALIIASGFFGGAYVLTPKEAGHLVDAAISNSSMSFVKLPVLVLILVATMSSLVIFGSSLAVTTSEHIRQRLFLALERSQSAIPSESIAARSTNDVLVVQTFVAQFAIVAFPSMGLVVISIVAAITVDPVLATPVIGALPVLVLVVLAIAKAAAARARPVHETLDVLSQRTRDILEGGHLLRTIPGATDSKYMVNTSDSLRSNAVAVGYVTSLLTPITLTLTGVLSVGLVGLGLVRLDAGMTTPGGVVEFVGYLGLVARGILGMAGSLQLFPTAVESLRRINEVADGTETMSSPRFLATGDGSAIELKHGTIFRDSATEPAVRTVNVSVPTQTCLNLVGRSGSGKSTLLEALAGMRPIESGEIYLHPNLLDDTGHVDALQNMLVSAEPTLTAGTIRTSIGLGNEGASDDEIWESLDVCQIGELVRSRGGLDCPVTSGADNFSGGERHRLALARAVLSLPVVLLADDPFRSLDTQTGRRLEFSLRQQQLHSALVIAQRRFMPGGEGGSVVLLEGGEVADEGTHDDLLRRNALYRRLHGIDTP